MCEPSRDQIEHRLLAIHIEVIRRRAKYRQRRCIRRLKTSALHTNASPKTTAARSANAKRRDVLLDISAVGRCRSMNVAFAAPRLIASSPSAPVPANRSIAWLPATGGSQQVEHRLADAILHRPRPQLAAIADFPAAERPADDPQARDRLLRVTDRSGWFSSLGHYASLTGQGPRREPLQAGRS